MEVIFKILILLPKINAEHISDIIETLICHDSFYQKLEYYPG